MSTRKPSVTARQQLITKKARLTDLAPRAGAARQVKGGPCGGHSCTDKVRKPS